MTPETRERFAARERDVIDAARKWADREGSETYFDTDEDRALLAAVNALQAEHEAWQDFLSMPDL